MIGWLNNQPFWRRPMATRYEFKYNLWRYFTFDIQNVISLSTPLYSVFQMNPTPIGTKIVKTMVGSWPKLHQTYSNSQVYTRPSRVKHKACLFESISSIHLLTSHLHTHLRSFYEPHAHKTSLDLGSDEKMQAREEKTFCWSIGELIQFFLVPWPGS